MLRTKGVIQHNSELGEKTDREPTKQQTNKNGNTYKDTLHQV